MKERPMHEVVSDAQAVVLTLAALMQHMEEKHPEQSSCCLLVLKEHLPASVLTGLRDKD